MIVSGHDDVITWKHFPRHWPVCGEFTGDRWIPLTKASDVEILCFLLYVPWLNKRLSKQSRRWWFGTSSYPLWRHCNGIRSIYGDDMQWKRFPHYLPCERGIWELMFLCCYLDKTVEQAADLSVHRFFFNVMDIIVHVSHIYVYMISLRMVFVMPYEYFIGISHSPYFFLLEVSLLRIKFPFLWQVHIAGLGSCIPSFNFMYS